MKNLKWLSSNEIAILKKWKPPTSVGGKDITTELQDLSEQWIDSCEPNINFCGEVLKKILRGE